jgi:hypothetical protein
MAANHRVAQVEVFDAALELTAVPFAEAAAKNDGQFIRPADGSVGIE